MARVDGRSKHPAALTSSSRGWCVCLQNLSRASACRFSGVEDLLLLPRQSLELNSIPVLEGIGNSFTKTIRELTRVGMLRALDNVPKRVWGVDRNSETES